MDSTTRLRFGNHLKLIDQFFSSSFLNLKYFTATNKKDIPIKFRLRHTEKNIFSAWQLTIMNEWIYIDIGHKTVINQNQQVNKRCKI